MKVRREQEDIARLIDETGIGHDAYRSFDDAHGAGPTVSSVSTQLLGEIFAKKVGPAGPDISADVSPAALVPRRPPIAVPQSPLNAFAASPPPSAPRRPVPSAPAASADLDFMAPRAAPLRPVGERPRLRAVPSGPVNTDGTPAGTRSSLNDIRGVLSRREEPVAEVKRTGPLSGLFDRLAK
jgi:hypothetical protein